MVLVDFEFDLDFLELLVLEGGTDMSRARAGIPNARVFPLEQDDCS
jgi:hypothetical protein